MSFASQKRDALAAVLPLTTALALMVCGAQGLGEQAWGRDAARSRGSAYSLSVHAPTAEEPTSRILVPSAAPAVAFTIADFTGDTHPDLATVELDRFDSTAIHYWIEIRLSEGGGQVLRLTAPFGGLLITPKDVTGDGNPDLLIQAAKTGALVAVFLNDGSGHFERANTAAFAKTLRDEPSQFALTTSWIHPSATLACPTSHTIQCLAGSLHGLRRQGSLISANYFIASHPSLSFGSNRAPPSLG